MASSLRIFAFFSLGYFVSYVFRGVNIGFSPFLSGELGLSAADLGALTGMYFLAFAAVQIPAGILLDSYGPRRVNALMMWIAALGTIVFGLAQSMPQLMLGRALIGIGVAVCLGATFKALAQVVPIARLPLVNGFVMAVGGMGGVVVGTPLSKLLEFVDWRAISIWLALPTVLVSLMIWFGTRAPQAVAAQRPTLASQLRGTLQIMTDAGFWQAASLPVITGGAFYAVQSLWVGPFLREVSGHTPAHAAGLVSVLGIAMVAGNIGLGVVARFVERAGISLYAFTGICMSLYLLVQLLLVLQVPVPDLLIWSAYGIFGSSSILSYAVMAERFPYQMLGRVSTTLTLVMFMAIFLCQIGMGWVVAMWQPLAGGAYPVPAHIAAWSALLAVQVLAAIWYFWPTRKQR